MDGKEEPLALSWGVAQKVDQLGELIEGVGCLECPSLGLAKKSDDLFHNPLHNQEGNLFQLEGTPWGTCKKIFDKILRICLALAA